MKNTTKEFNSMYSHLKNRASTSIFWPVFFLLACSSPKGDENKTVSNGDLAIDYTVSGDGEFTLVFVHGWCIDKSYWDDQVKFFDDNHKVIALDLGGHGQSGSSRQSWTVNDFAGDVTAVIEQLDLKNVVLIGHSMGGNIILEAANRIPERVEGFVGVDNFKDVGAVYTTEQLQEIKNYFDEFRNAFKSTASSYARQLLFAPTSDTISINRVIESFNNADSTMAMDALESLVLEEPQDEPAMLKKLNIPVYLINSDYTPTNTDSLAVYCKKGYHVKMIEGTGHYPMIERPDEFNQALDEILKEIGTQKQNQ